MSDIPPPPSSHGGPPPPPVPPPPPSYGPPPTAPAYLPQPVFRKVGGLAKAIVVLLVIFAISTLFSTLFTTSSRDDARDYIAGRISEDDFLDAVAPSVLFDFVGGVTTIALAVLTMIWMFRLAKNQRDLGRGGRWAPGWAIGGWFCPPVLFVIPMLMFRELWKASDPQVPGATEAWREAPEGRLVWWWWIFYGLVPAALIPLGISAVTTLSNDTVDLAKAMDDQFTFNVASSIASIIAALIYLMLVRQLTARQQELAGVA